MRWPNEQIKVALGAAEAWDSQILWRMVKIQKLIRVMVGAVVSEMLNFSFRLQISPLAPFEKMFEAILTDKGIEFGGFEAIERSCLSGARCCRVYYCDPQRSGQKGSCGENHAELRKIQPKESSFESLTAFDVATACSHVNNYPRKNLSGKLLFHLPQGFSLKTCLPSLESLGSGQTRSH